jgi:hypothetical protein
VWTTNDLIGTHDPVCAAGCADFIVRERSMGGRLEQAMQRLGRPTRVYRRLRELFLS